jgi:hypothetical protein
MRFASASIAARIDFRRNTPTTAHEAKCSYNVVVSPLRPKLGANLEFPKRSLSADLGALSNNKGDDNRAIGADALLFNISGDKNAALGRSAGVSTQFAAVSPSGGGIEIGTTPPQTAMK